MLRRHFFGLVVACAIGAVTPAALGKTVTIQVAPQDRSVVVAVWHDKHVSLEGDPAACIRIMHRYQQLLWPEWRTHPLATKIMRRAELGAWESGRCGVWAADPLSRQAAEEALREFGIMAIRVQ